MYKVPLLKGQRREQTQVFALVDEELSAQVEILGPWFYRELFDPVQQANSVACPEIHSRLSGQMKHISLGRVVALLSTGVEPNVHAIFEAMQTVPRVKFLDFNPLNCTLCNLSFRSRLVVPKPTSKPLYQPPQLQDGEVAALERVQQVELVENQLPVVESEPIPDASGESTVDEVLRQLRGES